MNEMKVLFLNAGSETGGGMHYILRVISTLRDRHSGQFLLGVFEKKELYHRANNLRIDTVVFEGCTKFSPRLLKQLKLFIEKESITHVHTHGPRANVYMRFLKNYVHVSWIITLHSNPYLDFSRSSLKGWLYTYLHVNSLIHADHIIAVCNEFKSLLAKRGVHEEKITTIRNGIDFSKEAVADSTIQKTLRKQHGFTSEDFIIVQVARLEKIKNHDLTIEALLKLRQSGYKNVHLLFIGDGSLKDRLREKVKQRYISENVHFYGEMKDVTPFYQIADVVMLTSDSESFPYVLLEAARERKPIIATNVGDVKELLLNDTFGWLIERGNIEQLTAAMKQANHYKQIGELERMGSLLHDYAKSRYTIEHCAEQVFSVYLKITPEKTEKDTTLIY